VEYQARASHLSAHQVALQADQARKRKLSVVAHAASQHERQRVGWSEHGRPRQSWILCAAERL